MPRLPEINVNLSDRLQEGEEQGLLSEVAAIETTMAAATRKPAVMRDRTAQPPTPACPTSAPVPADSS